MASKRKNVKVKKELGDHQIKFGRKTIDLKRFAYDMFVYSARKFQIPENCIYKWEGAVNDYGCHDFCQILFLGMMRFQIPKRYTMYRCFRSRYEANRLQLEEEVCDLYVSAFKMLSRVSLTVFDGVEASLAVASDLIIFLYSKNASLNVMKLVDFWFEQYSQHVKKEFEAEGGFEAWYKNCRVDDNKKLSEFCDDFICKHCSDYEQSANDEQLEKKFYKAVNEYYRQHYVKYAPDEEVSFSLVMQVTNFFVNPAPPPAPKRGKDSRSVLEVNPGLGITPHELLLQEDLPLMAGATTSQIASEEIPPRPWACKGSNSQQIRRRRRFSLSSNLESSGTKQLSDEKPSVLVVGDDLQSQNILDTSKEVPIVRTGSSSQQKSTSSACSSLDQDLQQLSLKSSGTKQQSGKKHPDDKTP